MDPLRRLDEEVQARLGPRGFVRDKGPFLSYVWRSDDGSLNRYVDVEMHRDVPGLRVVLQEVRQDGARRFELLEEFGGLHYYRFDPSDTASLSKAVDTVLKHLDRYGLRWLAGEQVATPALAERERTAQEIQYRDAVRNGIQSFKAGRYAEAVRHFDTATQFALLDPIAAKYRSIAARKTGRP